MSYEIIRSINEKERSVTSASNNVRPLMYETYHCNKDMSVEEFRANVIVNLLWGNYHYSNTKHIYNLVAAKVKASEEFKDFEEKIWNWNDTYTHEWVKENYDKNIAELKKFILKTFEEVKKTPKEKWVINDGCSCYIKRINKWTYSYCGSVDKAKVYPTKEMAKCACSGLPDYWQPVQL